jgi:non-specific serine/threonine protein kinase/serine/threonine-protein kinase
MVGEGGMGVVYEAEQETPVRRRVALKLIKPGMDTKQVVARFESERQALALMSHPSIASIFDGGATEEGRPYFAMELVHGDPLTAYCDKHRLTVRDRLELFLQVCEGVRHAHQKGVIHRDIKPSNILVTIRDDTPVPKIIDFGVAKATSQRLTDKTLYTQLGQWMGTPVYMSPEQAEMTGVDVDTRTDVYSLGVVLYELLAGALPFDPTELKRAGFEGLRRILRETEPPKPSARVQTLAKTPTDPAKTRRLELPALERELRGDLDWITMKALEKDRTRRYGSPSEFAEDIRRHLRHEPVVASPPSTAYRARKFVRRHRVGVAVGSLILGLLIAFAAAMTVQSVRIARERDRAETATKRAEQETEAAQEVSDFLVELFEVSDPSEARGNTVTAREILDEGAARIENKLEGQPRIQGRLANVMGKVYQSLGLYEPAQRLLEKALSVRRHGLGDEHPDVAESLIDLAWLENGRGRFDRAEELARQALAMQRRILGDEDPAVADSLSVLGGVTLNKRDYVAAEALFREGIAIRRRLGLEDEDTANLLNNMAIAVSRQGRFEEGVSLNREALAIRRETLGPGHPSVAQSLNNLGMLYWRSKDLESAEPLLREALELNRTVYGEDHPATAGGLHNVGLVLRDRGSYEEAESLHRRAVEIVRARHGDDGVGTAAYVEALAVTVGRAGRLGEEEALIRDALAVRRRSSPPGSVRILRAELLLGDCLSRGGRFAEAESLLVDAYAGLWKARGDEHSDTRQALEALVALYEAWGKPARGAEYHALLPEEEK